MFVEITNKNVPLKMWKAKGLNPNAKYLVSERKQYNVKKPFEKVMSGKILMEKGIEVKNLANTLDKEKFPDGVFTRLFYIKEIK